VDEAVGDNEGALVGESLNETRVGVIAAVEREGRAFVAVGKERLEGVEVALTGAEQSRGGCAHRQRSRCEFGEKPLCEIGARRQSEVIV
jgi:hypothetical protein